MANLQPINVVVNGEVAGKTFKELQSNVAGIVREMQRLKVGSDEWIAKAVEYDKAKANLQEARDAAKQVSDQINRLDPNSYKALQLQAKQTADELEKLPLLSEAWVAKTKEFEQIQKRLRDASQAAKDVAAAMNEAKPSSLVEAGQKVGELREKYGSAREAIRQMKAEAEALAKQMSKLPEGSDAWVAKSKDFEKITAELKNAEGAARQVAQALNVAGNEAKSFSFGDVAKFAGTFTGIQLGVQAAASAVTGFATDSVRAVTDFETSLSNLKALTGASADDLIYYREQAELMGETLGIGGAKAIEAFKLIGGAKPDLLANRDALAAVTKEAIALAQASGLELPEAANALASSLNQFGAGAEEAGRFINVLAAGAKEGSSEITDTAVALKNAGTVAAGAGLSFEQTNAAIQSLASIAIKGGEAGTGFRNVLLTLQAGANDTNPKVVGLQQALENLAAKNLDAAEMTKLFGKENVVVAQQLISSSGEIDRLTKAVSGTSEAYSQAADNTNNLEADFKKFQAATESLQISLLTGLMGALRATTQGAITFVLALKELPGFISDNKEAIGLLLVALVSLNANNIRTAATTLAHSAAEKGREVATKASAAAQWLLNAAMSANPIGLIIAAIALVVAGFVTLYKNSEMVRAGIQGLWNAIKELATMYVQFWKALLTGDISGVIDLFKNAGERIAGAFSSGYNDKIKEEHEANKKADADRAKDRADAEAKASNKATQAAAETKVGLIKKLEEQMKTLKDQLADAATRSEIERIRKQIVATQAALDDLTGKAAEERAKKAKEAAEKRKKEQEAQAKDELEALRKAQANERALIADATDRKVADLKAQAEIDKAAAEARKSTAETKAREIASIEAKLQKDIADTLDKAYKDQQDKAEKAAKAELDLRRRKAQALADLEVLLAEEEKRRAQQKGDYQGSQDAGRALLDAQLVQIQTAAQMQLEELGKTEEEKQLIVARSEAEMARIRDEYAQQQRESNAQTATNIINGFQTAFNTIADFQAIASQRDLKRVENDKNTRLKTLEAEYKAGKISKMDYEAKKAQIEQDFADQTRDIKNEQAKREKAYNIASAIMQGAIAVIAASANPLGVFSPTAIATAALAALNVAKVIATPLPTYAKGGLLPSRQRLANGGYVEGPSHKDGGVPIMYPDGRPMAEAEGGELVLSKAFVKANPRLSEVLLDASERGGSQLRIDTNLVKAAKYATGGVLPEQGGASAQFSGADLSVQVGRLADLMARQHSETIAELRNISPTLKAYVVAQEVGEELDKLRATLLKSRGTGTGSSQDNFYTP